MNRFHKTNTAILLIFLAFFSFNVSADANAAAEKKILVLLSFNEFLPWTESFKQGLKEARIRYGGRVQFYSENMEMIRLTTSLSDSEWAAYLSKKYQAVQFDAAIAESAKASLFLHRYGHQFLGDIPHVYHTALPIEDYANSKSLTPQFGRAIEKTLQMAIQQNNNAEQIVILDGQNKISRSIIKGLLPLTKNYPQLKVSILKNLSVADLQEKLSVLAKNSIVFYTVFFKDKTGKQLVPEEVLTTLAKSSAAPIYSFSSSFIGRGAVGGDLLDGATSARQMVNAAMDYLENGAFKKNYPTLQIIFDWQALTKYGINPNAVPDDAVIINKPISLLKMHFKEVLLLIITMMLFVLLITLYWARKLSRLNKQLKIANQNVISAQKRAERLAQKDYLSGMNNRRAFFDKARQVLMEAKRYNRPFSLLALDIDHFKKVNDRYGHAAGDEIIKNIAQTIELVKREMDIAARFGGEEFSILAPSTDIAGAIKLANRIRSAVEHSVHKFAADTIKISVSVGVFSMSAHSDSYSLQDYLKYSDDALYQAKQRGRNRVVVSDHDLCLQTEKSQECYPKVS